MFNLFKSKSTKEKEQGKTRSPHWASFRKNFLKGKTCAVCNTNKNLNAHHIKPFWKFPDLELSESNLICLCEPHHLFIGHLDNYKSYNENCANDATVWNNRIKERP